MAASSTVTTRSGVMAPAVDVRRSYAARADASETCCSRMICTSVPNPESRPHSGGGPKRSTTAARSRSRVPSSATATARVSTLRVVIPIEGCPGRSRHRGERGRALAGTADAASGTRFLISPEVFRMACSRAFVRGTGALSPVIVIVLVASLAPYLGATAAAAAVIPSGTAVVSAAPPTATFNPNLLLTGSSSAAEPSIRTDRFGQSFVIGPTGVPAGCKAFRIRHDGSASTFIGFPDHTLGGGDCDWAIGPQGRQLPLYSIFITPDSAADNVSQGAAGTSNFNRVYEAVGTVTDVLAPGAPIISWRNYEVFHGPIGARYDRIFPITAVDAGGNVYAIWTDGNHIMYKVDATGTGWNPAAAPGQIANPAGVNTTIMPWAAAGKSGIADVVFYGASGGAGAQPNPQDDPNNQWNAYMAQTVDGGATWGVFKASDHVIHTGPICIDGLGCELSTPSRDRTLLDFFQVSIDPTNGAADIAYADDHASPGSAVLYFTRQCTGASATTGGALANDCKAPPPPPTPPQGSTCPGPQIVDFGGDAQNNYPGGCGEK